MHRAASALNLVKKGMPILIMMGPPGVGKGTYGKKLSKEYNIPIFSLGDYFRGLSPCTTKSTFNYFEIQKCLMSGELIKDDVTFDIIQQTLNKYHMSVILDGFPRTLPQAHFLNSITTSCLALNFNMRDEFIVQKMMGRVECPMCHANYNVANVNRDGYVMPPILPKKDHRLCDSCNCLLLHRNDDSLDVINKRLRDYRRSSKEILKYYIESNRIIEFELKKGIEDIQLVKTALINRFK